MKFLKSSLLFFAYFCYHASSAHCVSTPEILTNLIEKGDINTAQKRATVDSRKFLGIKSYSGFITIDKAYNSNLFFWYFPSLGKQGQNDPLILVLQGGPGATSLTYVFSGNGPFRIQNNTTLVRQHEVLINNHNVIYLDHPVGSGYSFTDNAKGYASVSADVERALLAFLQQFLLLFPNLRKNNLFLAGDSYAGKYVVSGAKAVHAYNAKASTNKINLKGIMIGDGTVDHEYQTISADALHYAGLIDFNERNQVRQIEEQANELIRKGDFVKYYQALVKKGEILKNMTALVSFEDYMNEHAYDHLFYFKDYVQRSEIRDALHVGNLAFNEFSAKVYQDFVPDITKSLAPELAAVMENYKVLNAQGQLDMGFPWESTETFYRTLGWSGADAYRSAKRRKWYVNKELAGYWKHAGNFDEVMVRNAGHLVSYQKPAYANDLFTRFTRDDLPNF